ncbi:hypothetical protein [Ornithinimicrobium cerasi]|uniref:Htaa protein n=1 Tax=Ornithinimicrobium cerasi TaxID=2248773 RepID=A0A285VBS3_9MICO|nr:hypothetical protein [Ornithinimicrobium cerasi]SOC51417.1 hypothetical protein SAMN05421879_101187 [Ornithinimicrobium cerasi]
MSSTTRSLLASAAAVVLTVAVATPASARIVDRWSLDESFSGQSDPGYCGVEDLVVDFTYDQTGEARLHQRGSQGLLYYHASTTYVETVTYEGRTVSTYGKTLEKDVEVTDNGNGTWQVLVLLTGPARTVDEAGRVIAKNDGQTRLLLHIDAETGELLAEPEVVFGSTGTDDDFCAAVLEEWGL